MKNNKLIKLATYGVIGLVAAPTVINAGTKIILTSSKGIRRIINRAKLNRQVNEEIVLDIEEA